MLRLTRAQVREVDRRAIDDYHIPGIVLMENAARSLLASAWEMLERRAQPVVIVCGGGNNGGDGLAVARHLHNRGCLVEIALATDPMKFTGDALTSWRIVQAMHLPIGWRSKPALLIDALFGTGLSTAPRTEAISIIRRMNGEGVPILAVDVPSGLDSDTGIPVGEHCVRATRTVTFVAEKAGFANPESRQYTGEVIVGDIGCPRELIEEVARTSS